jgi:hypothetical protein
MNDDKKQHSYRRNYEKVSRYETTGLDFDLPEWIINLKNYFGKNAIQNDSPSHR